MHEWLTARPVAHRGLHDAAASIIENTPSAFAAAVAANYAIECDIRLSADGEAMVYHDDTLERLTLGSGRFDAQHATDPDAQEVFAPLKTLLDASRCVNLSLLAQDSVLDGQYAKAEEALRQVVALSEKSTAGFPDRVDLRHLHASSLNGLARFLVTCSDPRRRKPTESLVLAERSVKLAPRDGTCWNTLGIARYRAARWEEAITALKQSNDLRDGGTPHDWLFLAMAQWQLGHKEQARQWYARAVERIEKSKNSDDELRSFRAEADNLLDFPDPP